MTQLLIAFTAATPEFNAVKELHYSTSPRLEMRGSISESTASSDLIINLLLGQWCRYFQIFDRPRTAARGSRIIYQAHHFSLTIGLQTYYYHNYFIYHIKYYFDTIRFILIEESN
jgi:hypothetical protein